MAGTSNPETISTRLRRVAELSKKSPDMVWTTLAHHIDLDFLKEAHRLVRKDGAVGVDEQTAEEYAVNLEENLKSLENRFKSGSYKAPPVRRASIPKGDGKDTRTIGIPTFEDKILQRAVTMVLEAVYEQDFLDCSYGFRPGRSAHQALDSFWRKAMWMGGGYVLKLDIEKYFDMVDHAQLRRFLDKRVRDGVIRRTINKWLKAGVLQEQKDNVGTPQGGVISPLLANIYLHEVLDTRESGPTQLDGGRIPDPVCGRRHAGLLPEGGSGQSAQGASQTASSLRAEDAPGEDAVDPVYQTGSAKREE